MQETDQPGIWLVPLFEFWQLIRMRLYFTSSLRLQNHYGRLLSDGPVIYLTDWVSALLEQKTGRAPLSPFWGGYHLERWLLERSATGHLLCPRRCAEQLYQAADWLWGARAVQELNPLDAESELLGAALQYIQSLPAKPLSWHLSDERLIEWAKEALGEQGVSQITLLGFPELTPAWRYFFEQLVSRSEGLLLGEERFKPSSKPGRIEAYWHPHRDLEDAAQQLAPFLLHQRRLKRRTWVVVPDEGTRNALTRRLARLGFEVEQEIRGAFSYALNECPVVQSALLTLRCAFSSSLDVTLLLGALRLGYWGPSMEERSFLEKEMDLRIGGRKRWSWPAWLRWCESERVSEYYPALWRCFQVLGAFKGQGPPVPKRALFSHWMERGLQLLQQLNWPGGKTLSNSEWQQQQAFHRAVQTLLQSADEWYPLQAQEALALFERFLEAQPFVFEHPATFCEVASPVEALGFPADAMWWVNWHQGVVPAIPNPNPFIPVTLQRAKNLPYSHFGREQEIAGLRMEWLLQALLVQHEVAELHISYDDALGVHPFVESFLSRQANLQWLDGQPQEETLEVIRQNTLSLEWAKRAGVDRPLFDGRGLPPMPIVTLSQLQAQYDCPFQSQMKGRLGLKPWQPWTENWGARERGLALHALLHLYYQMMDWKRFRLDPKYVTEVQQKSIQRLADEYRHEGTLSSHPFFLSLEQKRWQRVLEMVSALEQKRPPFEEAMQEIALEVVAGEGAGAQHFRIRLDRLEQWDSHHKGIVDYKTGMVSIQDFSDTPQRLQMGIYARAVPNAGLVVYLQLGAGQAVWVGALHDGMPQVLLEWASGLSPEEGRILIYTDAEWMQWQSRMGALTSRLGQDLMNGADAILPRRGESTCHRCGFQSLCRIELTAS